MIVQKHLLLKRDKGDPATQNQLLSANVAILVGRSKKHERTFNLYEQISKTRVELLGE